MSALLLEHRLDFKLDGKKILSDLVHYRTYAAIKSNGRKESREEVIDRVKNMHIERFPRLQKEIEEAFEEVYLGRVIPSMRTMQFAGEGIKRSHARVYNCSYAALTSWKDFADCFWLMMNGVGAGYSVQKDHISLLPEIKQGYEKVFFIADTKESWADSIIELLENPKVSFFYGLIRKKGEPLSTGGTSSGPELLEEAHEKIRKILLSAIGRKLKPIECFDIMCHIADVVVVGGVRRAATIALFNADDNDMLNAKSGSWWENNPQRARANISAVINRNRNDYKQKIKEVVEKCFENETGEPGVALTNDHYNYGSNPCMEIALKHRGFCNLTEINIAGCSNEKEFYKAVKAAATIGTLQASYTDFYYLHPDWQKNAEEEALLGISITGQANNWDLMEADVIQTGAKIAVETNKEWAKKLGINTAARITTVKPSGTTSAWLGTTSGIHAAHSSNYIRRVRVDRKDPFGKYLIEKYGEHEANSNNFIESDEFSKENIVVSIPISMNGAITRDGETALELMERAKYIYKNWILPGHIEGKNTHNVSLTVNYKQEKEEIINWMIENSDYWNGISLLPYDGGKYSQAPFEEISEEEYREWLNKIPKDINFQDIDFSNIVDSREAELACNGNGCEIV